ncbi:hypothetical protein LTR50_003272 [Elasticomyces elasticus]|nr:hypothetical protein LTR50_003272 [Elasticomyces elasticus]
MPFSHHSHSGQFCGHAKNTLEEMVQAAIDKGMTTFALTEHMPRDVEDLYPEEDTTAEGLVRLYDDFHAEATRLRQKYASQIRILIGFETEWIRPSSLPLINTLLGKHDVDLFIGSVHHVHAIPIDFDHDMYYKARQKAGGSDERIFEQYFDSQYAMLQALKPPVVGHFDLIRLKSDNPDRGFEQWPMVWSKILRNLELIASYGGILELNSSALRKGMSEPYPQISICKTFLHMGGRFTLSDDSHGVEQVGLNYHRVLEAVRRAGISEIYVLTHEEKTVDCRFPGISAVPMSIEELERHRFWSIKT